MCAEEFTHLLRPLEQHEMSAFEADIEAGWQKLAARLDKLNNHRNCGESYCIDLPSPHGRLAAPVPPRRENVGD